MALPRPALPRRQLTATVVITALLLLGTAVAPTGGRVDRQPVGPGFAQTGSLIDADAVHMVVDLQADGTAAWRVEYRVRLDDENTTAAFEDLRADIRANRSAYAARFEERMADTVGAAATATGREMALRNVSVAITTRQLPEPYGVLVYTFEWAHFAAVEEGRLHAGDALAGLFLDADTTLLMAWPDGYETVEVSPEPTERRERSVLWRGPTDFGPGEPALVAARSGGTSEVDPSLVGLAVVAAVLLGGGLVWWWRRRGGPTATDHPSPGSRAGAGTTSPADELLSNEERVISLLEANGGRMKQQDVVDALGWSDAKTSQVVGRLREADRIEGFRLGRENVLRLPTDEDHLGPEDRSVVDDHREA